MGFTKEEAEMMAKRVQEHGTGRMLQRALQSSGEQPYATPVAILVDSRTNVLRFDISPCPAPRMVRSDKWKPEEERRPRVARYFAFRDQFRAQCAAAKWTLDDVLRVDFFVPMPASWSKKKKKLMFGQPHKQRPDIDNFSKAVMDSFGKDDGFVWSLHATKRWSHMGAIEVHTK